MTDRPDDAPSSDELLRRARMGLGETPQTPDFTDGAPDGDPLASGPVDTPAPSDPPPPSPEPVAAAGLPGDDSGSLLPDHFRPENETPTTKKQSSFNWVRWVIPIGVVGYILFTTLTADTAVDDLSIGDCFMNPTETEITTVETVDCTEPHDYEVYAFAELAASSSGFPGDAALFAEAGEECFDPFLAYTGLTVESQDFDFFYEVFIPDRTSWEDGNRESMCAVYAIDGDFNPVMSSGSARAG
jgi:hypothetical protein